jgi:hypothetical protein
LPMWFVSCCPLQGMYRSMRSLFAQSGKKYEGASHQTNHKGDQI